MTIGWKFPGNDNGEIVGIGAAGIETFKGSLFTSLAKEICQNSLDARLDSDQPVRVDFILNQIPTEKIPGIDELKEAVGLCQDYWDDKKTKTFFKKAVKLCEADYMRVLRISDYNTTGLTGSTETRPSPWNDLVKSSGVSNKCGESGGSFGIGKSAPFACSDLRTLFYHTLDKDGIRSYQGVANLVSFQYQDGRRWGRKYKGEVTQGKGYYGDKSDNSAVHEAFSLDDYVREETGTDLYVLGFLDQKDWKEAIIKAVLDGYIISIFQNDLEVRVDDIVLNRHTMAEQIEKYREQIPITYNYYRVLTSHRTVYIRQDFNGLGELELHILLEKGFIRKVLMARSNGMKVFDKGNISGTIPFAGVCILKDQPLNEYFREMENPQHNKWEPDRHSRRTEAKKRRTELFRFIKEQVKKIGASTVLDEMDAVGAGEFIPDLDPVSGAEQNPAESISNDVKEFSDLEKRTMFTAVNATQQIEDGTIEGEITDFGESVPGGELAATEYRHSDGSAGVFRLENRGLLQMVQNNEAEFLLHIESPASSYRLAQGSKSPEMTVHLKDEHLLGKVSLCPFLVAKKDLDHFSNQDWVEDYQGVTFQLEKGTILAIGTQQTFTVDKEDEDLSQVPSIFTIYKKETTDEMPMEVELNDNKIRVGLNIHDYESYSMKVQSHPDIINAFLLYPVWRR